jgi:hypothetical protein
LVFTDVLDQEEMIMSAPDESLKDELGYFQERKDELLKQFRGQFALIRGRELFGTFTTYAEAYEAGVKMFGNAPMLIRRIAEEEPMEQAPALMHGLLRIRA